jgi:glycosyltransferase involved in cell wall biosynthesis
VTEAELEEHYARATCFVLPSLIEGFGLPVLEAMARGVPVACSNRPALPEVAGDAALLFNPEDQQAVTDAIRRLLRDDGLARTLAERGRRRADTFTWERTAEATLASYRRALAAKIPV